MEVENTLTDKNGKPTLVLVTLPSSSLRWCWDSVKHHCPAAICSLEHIFKHAMMLLSVLRRALSPQGLFAHVGFLANLRWVTSKTVWIQNARWGEKWIHKNDQRATQSQRGSLFTFPSPGKKERRRKIYIQDGFISSSPQCTWENRSWLTGHFASVRVWKAWMNNLISLCWLWGRKNKNVCLQQRNIGCWEADAREKKKMYGEHVKWSVWPCLAPKNTEKEMKLSNNQTLRWKKRSADAWNVNLSWSSVLFLIPSLFSANTVEKKKICLCSYFSSLSGSLGNEGYGSEPHDYCFPNYTL